MKRNSILKTVARHPRRRRSHRQASAPASNSLALAAQATVRDALLCAIQGAVGAMAQELVRAELEKLVGTPWSRKPGTNLRRGGNAPSRIFLGGEPHEFERPRVRDVKLGREVQLETMLAFGARDALDDDVKRLLVRGISTRQYDPALDRLADGLGLQRSAVSAAFQRASAKDLDALNGRSLQDTSFVSVFIDGVHFAGVVVLVAMGITTSGEKRILGLREGATENAEVVKDLLADISARGMTLAGRALFVIDGAKALRKAVTDTFGDRALIQRCQIHKARNVAAYLPKAWHAELNRRLRAAWSMSDYSEARAALKAVVRLAAHLERPRGRKPGGGLRRDADGPPPGADRSASRNAVDDQPDRIRLRSGQGSRSASEALARRKNGHALDRQRPRAG